MLNCVCEYYSSINRMSSNETEVAVHNDSSQRYYFWPIPWKNMHQGIEQIQMFDFFIPREIEPKPKPIPGEDLDIPPD